MRLSFVIPVLNEEENICPLYDELLKVVSEIGCEFEIIFVDDGSTDRSLLAISDLHSRDPRVKMVSFSRNFGHQIAITAGMEYACGDAVIMMDADFQHPPSLIAKMVEKWQEGYHIVYTLREYSVSESWIKRATSAAFYRIFRRLSNISLPFNTADFRLLDRKVVDVFGSIRERTRFLRGLTSWVGYHSIALPYRAESRKGGVSKYTLKKMLKFAMDGIVSFSTAPLYASIYLGISFALAGFAYGCYILYIYFFSDRTLPGWTSLIMVMILLGGLQLIVLGVIGVYIGKIYEEVKQRPLYLVRETLGFGSK